MEEETSIDFRPVAGFLKLPAGTTLGCSAVDIDSRGNVYVISGSRRPSVLRLVRTVLEIVGRLAHRPRNGHARPSRPAHRSRRFYLDRDRDRHLVRKFDASGQLLLTLGTDGSAGTGEQQFNRPADVAFGPSGEIYVADGYGNSRVVKFDRGGRFLKTWGEKGTKPGQFDLPDTIVVGPDGRVYVGDRYNWRIQIFDSEGKLQEIWPDIVPAGIVFDRGGTLFVSDGVSQVICNSIGEVKSKVLGNRAADAGPGKRTKVRAAHCQSRRLSFCSPPVVG